MKIGDTFKTRDGKLVTVFSLSGSESHPVVAIDSSKSLVSYTRDGYFISSNVQHARDLVERL